MHAAHMATSSAHPAISPSSASSLAARAAFKTWGLTWMGRGVCARAHVCVCVCVCEPTHLIVVVSGTSGAHAQVAGPPRAESLDLLFSPRPSFSGTFVELGRILRQELDHHEHADAHMAYESTKSGENRLFANAGKKIAREYPH